MEKKDQNTEIKILNAAQEEFVQKGMSGARMQEIANRAGINKALLHYYYRSKEKLFLAVFKLVISLFFPKIEKIIYSEENFFDKIRMFVEHYSNLLLKNQFLPLFILHEINRNPDSLIKEIFSQGINPDIFLNLIQKEINAGRIKNIDPKQFMINMLSLVIFPIAGRPMLQQILYQNNKKEYDEMLKKRPNEVAELIIDSIKN